MKLKYLPFPLAALLLCTVLPLAPVRAADPLVANGDFTNGMDGWLLSKLENTAAEANVESIEGGKKAVHIKVPQAGAKRYYVQLVKKGVVLREDKTYHLHFRARSKPASSLVLIAAAYHGKFDEMWRQENIEIKEDWGDYTCDIKPKFADDSAQLLFSGLAGQAGDYWITDVTLSEE